MRTLLIPLTGLMLLMGSAAQAAVSIVVDKSAQQMTVSVDGQPRYTWPVSSGNPSHETPNGTFRTFRMEADHYSKEFDDAPMPNSIFFTKQGHAIHGTDAVSRLGTPVSHGCVRLSRANALKLWDLVKTEGLLSTTVTLTGSSQVALARLGRGRTNVATTNGDAGYDTNGQPMQIAPQDRQVASGGYYNGDPRQLTPRDRAYYYGNSDPRWPAQQQQRGYQGGYYEQDARYQRPQYQYAPRGGLFGFLD
ncbi:L,D-transpeptidase [Bradyrhizobium sp. SYSU BS000235]|uniref:L,D-transpeptidase n=1 Tax=Bradyrhizobium sp. SYSU BS000235 TaxID=3411332 RepID=UPI003C73783F